MKFASLFVFLGLVLSAPMALAQDRDEVRIGPLGEITRVQDPENVVASELLGAWQLDANLTAGLSGSSDQLTALVFRNNPDAEPRVRKLLQGALDKLKQNPTASWKLTSVGEALRAVYLMGEVELTLAGDKPPIVADFFLVNLRGNPHVFIATRDGDIESFNVMLARDEDGEGDLLFIGGDFNNTSFVAFRRPPADEK